MSLNNFRASVSIPTKIFHTTCSEAGMITRVQLLEGPPPKIPEGQKTSKFRPDFWQLSSFIANISGTDRHIEHLRKTWSATTPSTLGEKTLVNFGPQTKKFYWSYCPTHVDIFLETTFRPLGGAAPWNFLFALEIDQGYLAHTQAGTGSPPKKKLIPKI